MASFVLAATLAQNVTPQTAAALCVITETMKKLFILFLILIFAGCATELPITEFNIRNVVLNKTLYQVENRNYYSMTLNENKTVTDLMYSYKSCTPIESGLRWGLHEKTIEFDYGNNVVKYEVTYLTTKKVILKNNENGKISTYKIN